MRPIATDVASPVDCLSVPVSPTKAAEQIEKPLGGDSCEPKELRGVEIPEESLADRRQLTSKISNKSSSRTLGLHVVSTRCC